MHDNPLTPIMPPKGKGLVAVGSLASDSNQRMKKRTIPGIHSQSTMSLRGKGLVAVGSLASDSNQRMGESVRSVQESAQETIPGPLPSQKRNVTFVEKDAYGMAVPVSDRHEGGQTGVLRENGVDRESLHSYDHPQQREGSVPDGDVAVEVGVDEGSADHELLPLRHQVGLIPKTQHRLQHNLKVLKEMPGPLVESESPMNPTLIDGHREDTETVEMVNRAMSSPESPPVSPSTPERHDTPGMGGEFMTTPCITPPKFDRELWFKIVRKWGKQEKCGSTREQKSRSWTAGVEKISSILAFMPAQEQAQFLFPPAPGENNTVGQSTGKDFNPADATFVKLVGHMVSTAEPEHQSQLEAVKQIGILEWNQTVEGFPDMVREIQELLCAAHPTMNEEALNEQLHNYVLQKMGTPMVQEIRHFYGLTKTEFPFISEIQRWLTFCKEHVANGIEGACVGGVCMVGESAPEPAGPVDGEGGVETAETPCPQPFPLPVEPRISSRAESKLRLQQNVMEWINELVWDHTAEGFLAMAREIRSLLNAAYPTMKEAAREEQIRDHVLQKLSPLVLQKILRYHRRPQNELPNILQMRQWIACTGRPA